ncbi:DNA replication licensing factor MCM8 [Novymonas esmeraldas]|uniref:DNA replication licensing factor MCM8 n=1 Tax=Novymonas esmeraldas TaxID=1808958 RepID=A0AAW0EUH9_9TRYP
MRGRRSSGAAVAADDHAWMEALWELHCGVPLAGAVRYTDAIVETMWELFSPLLSGLDRHPLAAAEVMPESVTATTAATTPLTDLVALRLVEPGPASTAAQRHRNSSSTAGVGDDADSADGGVGTPLTPVMRAALLERPRIVLALLEFFVAVWLHQHTAQQPPPSSSAAAAAAAAAAAPAAQSPPLLRHVYAAVSGEARSAIPFDHIGAAQLGRLLAVRGTVVRMSPTRISCVRMSYRCGHCGVVVEVATEDGVLVYPGPCPSGRCRGLRWTPLTDVAVCEEVQLLRLQEYSSCFDTSSTSSPAASRCGGAEGGSQGGNGGSGGGMHVMIEVELRPPWLDAVTVGDGVFVCGVLETRRSEGKKGGGMQQVCLRARGIRGLRSHGAATMSSAPSSAGVRALHHLQRSGGGRVEEAEQDNVVSGGGPTAITAAAAAAAAATSSSTTTTTTAAAATAAAAAASSVECWSAEEAGRLYEVARHPHWFARLTASVAPSIFGMEEVKEALLLAIVGGNRDKNGGETRSSIHVLLVGDPGLGKSQLLRAACAVAPRSAFVCAHTSSSCGLTITLTRDPVSGETTFEAGAVVHGDGGITCLDEIDKGVQEHKALLEVMEQETVSLAKAGMIFSMPVRTSVLAAGNPIGGRFDTSKSLAANVNLSPALLSRFDIIACLRNPHGNSAKVQQALTDHVLQWHRRGTGGDGDGVGGGGGGAARRTGGGGGGGALPLALVQRFLIFCRAQCQPTLCRDACDVLRAHYLAQRRHVSEPHTHTASSAATVAGGLDTSAVTPRYLQALIRVSEARAKLELRDEVTREDAEYAVQLLQSCLHSFDGLTAAAAAAAGGTSADSGKKATKLNQRDAVLQRLKLAIVEDNGGVNLFTEQAILDVCEAVGCRSASMMLRQLSEYGFLLQKSGSRYCLRGC